MAEPRRRPVPEETFNASEPEQVSKAKAAAELRAQAIKTFLIAALKDPAGRNWFFDLLSAGHMYATSFDSDPHAMAFKEGERNLALRIQAQIADASPEAVLLIMTEQGKA